MEHPVNPEELLENRFGAIFTLGNASVLVKAASVLNKSVEVLVAALASSLSCHQCGLGCKGKYNFTELKRLYNDVVKNRWEVMHVRCLEDCDASHYWMYNRTIECCTGTDKRRQIASLIQTDDDPEYTANNALAMIEDDGTEGDYSLCVLVNSDDEYERDYEDDEFKKPVLTTAMMGLGCGIDSGIGGCFTSDGTALGTVIAPPCHNQHSTSVLVTATDCTSIVMEEYTPHMIVFPEEKESAKGEIPDEEGKDLYIKYNQLISRMHKLKPDEGRKMSNNEYVYLLSKALPDDCFISGPPSSASSAENNATQRRYKRRQRRQRRQCGYFNSQQQQERLQWW